MSKKIVCISFINESAEFVEVERSKIGNFTLSPAFVFTKESLLAACSRADEIYINGLFPTAQFEREIFPKVHERYLRPLVTSFIQRKNPDTDISVRYQYIRDVMIDGNASPLVALQSVEKKDIEFIFELFKEFRKKIKNIYSLPTALAGAVVHFEKPTGNTMFLWVKENIALIGVISADGVVDIARSLPYGIPDEEDPDAGHLAASTFSEDISREVIMTANYFKQNFRELAPEKMYFLGDERLQKIFEDFPIHSPDISVHFGLAGDLQKGIDPVKLNKNVHLLGSIFANESFSFLPIREVEDRRFNTILSGVLVGVVLLIGLAGLWTLTIPGPQSHNDLVAQIQESRFDIQELETAITDLKPIEAKKKYYQSAFLDKKPKFIAILQQIATIMPPEMVFESFTMSSEERIWNCMITGKIRGQNWQERLDILRKFGKDLYSFSNFEIQNTNHSLGQAGMDATSISFQLSLQLIPGEEKK
jgi:hypothetical protein